MFGHKEYLEHGKHINFRLKTQPLFIGATFWKQSDQIALRKNRLKCSPTQFCQKLLIA
jgi:hypothetical protein